MFPATQIVIEELKQKNAIKSKIKSLIEELKLYEKMYQDIQENHVEKNNHTFIRHCPSTSCRGYLSTQWKCGLCEIWACPHCHEIKGDSDHICKTENIETAKLLVKETKPCPKCGVCIFKITGCDQMWCTQCKTPFSWKTGRIETQTIHNPHYFEYMRNIGKDTRDPYDIQCGREIDNNFLAELFYTKNFSNTATHICRCLIHLRSVEMMNFTVDRVTNNQDLRIKYMNGELEENKFKTLLQNRDKNSNKKHEIANILGMFITNCTDIMYRYLDALRKNQTSFDSFYEEIDYLRIYANSHLEDISRVYQCKKYAFDKTCMLSK